MCTHNRFSWSNMNNTDMILLNWRCDIIYMYFSPMLVACTVRDLYIFFRYRSYPYLETLSSYHMKCQKMLRHIFFEK